LTRRSFELNTKKVFTFLCFIVITALCAPGANAADEGVVTVLKASKIYMEDGSVVDNGIVLIIDGKIVSAGATVDIPDNAEIISYDGHLTPGLIDAASSVGVINTKCWAEHCSEVVPQMKNIDAVDLESKALKRLSLSGVTTIYVTPDAASVIGCRGTIIKTGGPVSERVVKDKWDVKITLGTEGWTRGAANSSPRLRRRAGTTEAPVDMFIRRPTTRMGMTWIFRKTFYDVKVYQAELKAKKREKDPALEIMLDVQNKKIPLRIKATEDIDIWSSIRLAGEFGLEFILEGGIESYKCIPELKEYGVPVIYGPVYQSSPRYSMMMFGSYIRPCLNSPKKLAEAGVPLALTAGALNGEGALPHQAGFAIRYGLSFENAFKAVTSTPAKMLGLHKKTGAIKPGLDADLVIWTDKPFSMTAKPALVMIKGRVVYKDM